MLIRHMDRIGWDQLEDPDSPFQITTPFMYGQATASHFLVTGKGDPFIKR